MSFKGTILFRKKDAVIPDAFAEHVLAKVPAFLSSAFIDEKTISVDAITGHSISDLKDAQELVKDRDSVFYLGEFTEPEESLQPFYVLKNDKDEPEMVAFLDGDFSNYADAKSSNSDAFHALNKYFRPRIEKWYKKGGLDNVLEELDDAATKEDIRNTFLGRGAVMFFAVNGKHIFIQNKNPEYMEFPWGFASNGFEYKEEAKTSVPQTGAKKLGIFGKKKDQQVSPKSADGDKVEAPPQQAPTASAGKEKETASTDAGKVPTAASEEGGTLVAVGWKPTHHANITRKEKVKSYKGCPFYDLWLTQAREGKLKLIETDGVWLPEGYKNGVPLFVKVSMADATGYLEKGAYLKDAPGKVIANGSKKEQGYPERLPAEQVEQNRANKDTAPKNIPQPEETAGYKPFGPEEEGTVAEVKKWFAEATKNKFIAIGSSQELSLDPAKMQSLETDVKSPLDAAGLELEDFLRLSDAGHIDLCRKYPVWYAKVTSRLAYLYWGLKPKAQRPQPTDHVKEPKKVEEKAPISASGTPAKKSIFAPRKKVA
jgi:hypothetical protein